MANYKTEATAAYLADQLALRTGLPASWAYVGTPGVPTVTLGSTSVKSAGGVTIVLQDQRGEVDAGWDALPGFNGSQQPVYTTGVAKVINESTVDVSAALVAAFGTFTMNAANAPLNAGDTILINGVTLTVAAVPANESEFAPGADDNASATNLAACINKHSVLKTLVVAVATLAATSSVKVTALISGAAGNAITTTAVTVGAADWGAATFASGAGGSTSMITPFSIFLKVWASIAKRGLKMEFWQTAVGTAPTAGATSYLQAEFYPNEFWPISGLT